MDKMLAMLRQKMSSDRWRELRVNPSHMARVHHSGQHRAIISARRLRRSFSSNGKQTRRRAVFADRHFGHSTASSDDIERISFSNFSPQDWH